MGPQCHLTCLIMISCPKSFSSTHSVDQIWWFSSLSLYNIFTNGLSIWETFDQLFRDLWAYLFIITYLNVTKTFHLIDSKNLPGEFYVTTGPGFWALLELILLKMCLVIFQTIWCQQWLFPLQQMLILISRINPVFIQEITVFD